MSKWGIKLGTLTVAFEKPGPENVLKKNLKAADMNSTQDKALYAPVV